LVLPLLQHLLLKVPLGQILAQLARSGLEGALLQVKLNRAGFVTPVILGDQVLLAF
jgi:hypothetical protein